MGHPPGTGTMQAVSACRVFRMHGLLHCVHMLSLRFTATTQDNYVGLRSAAAGGRFLQARRKGAWLGLGSTLLGVWEQWQVRWCRHPPHA